MQLKGSPVLDCAGKTGPPLRWFTPSQTSAGKWYQANMRPPRYFLVRSMMAFPRPGRAPLQGRRAEGLSRPARFRAPRKGLVLIRQGAAPSLGMLGRIDMADLEITPVAQHRPGDAGKFIGERDGQLVGMQPVRRCFDPSLEAVTLPVHPLYQHHSGGLYEQSAQICVSALGDPAEDGAAAG